MIDPGPSDIGRRVVFRPAHGEPREGVVTSFDARWVFVRFDDAIRHVCFLRGELSWATPASDAQFKDE